MPRVVTPQNKANEEVAQMPNNELEGTGQGLTLTRKFSVEQMQEARAWQALDVEPAGRERYLSSEDFGSVFGMNQDAFAQLKTWRRERLKKQHRLF